MSVHPPIGNNILEGVLGVVDIIFDGVYLGRTTADTEIIPEEDNKEIMFGQAGTKADDLVPTGISYTVNCTFGEITADRIELLQRGFTGNATSGVFGRDIYISRREYSKVLKIIRVNSEGQRVANEEMIITFYNASPQITGTLLGYGPDLQRNIPVTFYIFYNTTNRAFGYYGNASSQNLVPAA